MFWTTLVAFAALAVAAPKGLNSVMLEARQGGYTMLRFGCAQVVIDRLDPLVNPGVIPSPHLHQVVGGNAFNATITTGDVSDAATCTTCEFSQDFSNYWTANLFYKAKNGTFKRVPQGSAALQFNDAFSNQIDGGTLVYYVSAAPGQITAFKPGFRMLLGDVDLRTNPGNSMKLQNCYRCYTAPNYGGDVYAPCQGPASLDYQSLPPKPCPGGIRSNIHFPTCWDGKNLDSPNHKDHVAYPVTGPATFLSLGGACPATHPVRIPQLMYEVVWNTIPFNSLWDSGDKDPEDSQPFYLSQGDNTGYGQHADYVFGWKGNALQSAMDVSGCLGARCAQLTTQAIGQAKSCSVRPEVHENLEGWLPQLPGQGSMSGGM